MFPWSCSCGSGTVGLCVNVNACACLSGLLLQLNRNSLHKACLSHMTLNIHGPVSCTNTPVSVLDTARKRLQFTSDLSTEDEWMWPVMGILPLTQCSTCLQLKHQRFKWLVKGCRAREQLHWHLISGAFYFPVCCWFTLSSFSTHNCCLN